MQPYCRIDNVIGSTFTNPFGGFANAPRRSSVLPHRRAAVYRSEGQVGKVEELEGGADALWEG